jgi:hypothetical protein
MIKSHYKRHELTQKNYKNPKNGGNKREDSKEWYLHLITSSRKI